MLAKCSVFIATSLDGFIAREDGGITIQSFIAGNLINELTITLVPVLLGSGRSLFGTLAHDIELNQLATHTLGGGFVQVKYKIDATGLSEAKND